jgi:hypothetical protein
MGNIEGLGSIKADNFTVGSSFGRQRIRRPNFKTRVRVCKKTNKFPRK